MATRSVILAWKIPWTEEPGGLQSMGSQRVKLNLVKEPDTGSLIGRYFSIHRLETFLDISNNVKTCRQTVLPTNIKKVKEKVYHIL